MKKLYFASFLLLLIAYGLSAQHVTTGNPWKKSNEDAFSKLAVVDNLPTKYAVFTANRKLLKHLLEESPIEFTDKSRRNKVILFLPKPDSTFERFEIQESPIMSEELSTKFPEIKSYNGVGLDDPSATMRISFSHKGFNAFVISDNGAYLVIPALKSSENYYASYSADENPSSAYECLMHRAKGLQFADDVAASQNLTGETLRRYRIIVSANLQLYNANGNNDANVASTINILINNVNAIYEREVTIRLIFQNFGIDRNGTIFAPNQDLNQMKEINQVVIDNTFGNANYDTGHVLGFNPSSPSGLSTFSAFCNNPIKAKTATIVTLDLFQSTVIMAHELGHQFNARHSFTSFNGGCGPANDPNGRFEPGSGSTIMSYASICGSDNLQAFSDAYFHYNSNITILNYVDSVVPGCGERLSTGNSPPVISGASGVDANIPVNTPFTLTGFASDPNNDPITYSWEQLDAGTGLPIFRSYLPSTSSSRTFPSLPFILNNANVPPTFINGFLVGEILPNTTRTLTFGLSVRDNRLPAGNTLGFLRVFVNGSAGPFTVTSPNSAITWTGNTQQTVSWNLAGTNLAPISTANVRILLSTDGGQTFPTVLSNSTTNDGSEVVTVPNLPTSTARAKIEAINNVYFDISNTNFTINPGSSNIQVSLQTNPAGRSFTVDGSTFNAAQTFTWTSGSSHTISVVSPQGTSGTRYVWSNWSDGGAVSHTISPTSSGTYTANFTTQYQLTLTSAPSNGGLVAPASGSWFNSGQSVQISASANSGFVFNSWIGSGNGSYTGGNSSAAVVMSAPITQTANFTAVPSVKARFDYDGDRKTDVSVFRPSNGIWYIQNSSNGAFSINQWGLGSDLIVPADYDGDGKTDIAVWRSSTGVWFWINSSNGTVGGNQFGTTGDKPIPGDFDGDSKADITIFRPLTGAWWSLRSSNGVVTVQQFGISEDKPVIGDFDGDAKCDLAVFRPSNSTWYRVNSNTGALIIVGFGLGEDKPVAADYDGDNKTDIAIFRPSNGAWYWLNSSNGAVGGVLFGLSEDKPTPGDYDGDGKSDPAVFRPSQNTWYLLRSTMGFTAQQFGVTGDSPTPNSFN